jgi:hypothetical protein
MLSEEEVNELVFDPTTQDQINAMRSFGATDVGGTLKPEQDPVLTNKGSEIVRQSGQDLDIDVDEEVEPMITFKPKPLINIGTDITEEDIQEETARRNTRWNDNQVVKQKLLLITQFKTL